MGVNTYSSICEGKELYGYCLVIVWLLCGASSQSSLLQTNFYREYEWIFNRF